MLKSVLDLTTDSTFQHEVTPKNSNITETLILTCAK